MIQRIDTKGHESLNYIKYPNFNYEDFKPTEGKITGNDFYEIGYTVKNEIKEVIHYVFYERAIGEKFIVYEFDRARVLLYKVKYNARDYMFTPIVFVMIKNASPDTPHSLMINIASQSNGNVVSPGITYQDFPLGTFADISAIMILDKNFFPTGLTKLIEGNIVYESTIFYNPGNIVDHESASIFFPIRPRPNLKINENTCIESVLFPKEAPDLVFPVHPDIPATAKAAPLWFFWGAHDYRR